MLLYSKVTTIIEAIVKRIKEATKDTNVSHVFVKLGEDETVVRIEVEIEIDEKRTKLTKDIQIAGLGFVDNLNTFIKEVLEKNNELTGTTEGRGEEGTKSSSEISSN